MFVACFLTTAVECAGAAEKGSDSVNEMGKLPRQQIVLQQVQHQHQRKIPFQEDCRKAKDIRGLIERTTVLLRSRASIVYQNDLKEYIIPFRANTNKTNSTCIPAPEKHYPTDFKIWNSGRLDSWNTARDPGINTNICMVATFIQNENLLCISFLHNIMVIITVFIDGLSSSEEDCILARYAMIVCQSCTADIELSDVKTKSAANLILNDDGGT